MILLATLVLARWSFERGFTEFLHAQEMDRLSRIAQDITTEYLTDVSDITELNRRSLDRLLGKHTQGNVPPRGARRPSRGSAEGSAEGTAERSVKRPPPPRPSIDVSQCKQIFEPLYRHDKARTRNTGGAGLGLAICKNIVSAHSGTISAEPALAGGIKITMVLPIFSNSTVTSDA